MRTIGISRRRFDLNSHGDSTLNDRPLLRISPGDLEGLLGTLDVSFVALSECLVSMGYSLELGGMNAPGIHYNIVGTGRALIGNRDPIPLMPHTLIVVPPNSPFRMALFALSIDELSTKGRCDELRRRNPVFEPCQEPLPGQIVGQVLGGDATQLAIQPALEA